MPVETCQSEDTMIVWDNERGMGETLGALTTSLCQVVGDIEALGLS